MDTQAFVRDYETATRLSQSVQSWSWVNFDRPDLSAHGPDPSRPTAYINSYLLIIFASVTGCL